MEPSPGHVKSAERAMRPFGIALLLINLLWDLTTKIAEHAILSWATEHLEAKGAEMEVLNFAVRHPVELLFICAGLYLVIVLAIARNSAQNEASERTNSPPASGYTVTAIGADGSHNPTAVGSVGGRAKVTIGDEIHHHHYDAGVSNNNAPWQLSTSGLGNNSVDTGMQPTRLTIDKLGLTFGWEQLPKQIDVGGNSVTISFEDRFLIVNDHGAKVSLSGQVFGTQLQQVAVPESRPRVMAVRYGRAPSGFGEGLYLENDGEAAFEVKPQPLMLPGGGIVTFAIVNTLKKTLPEFSMATVEACEGHGSVQLDPVWRKAMHEQPGFGAEMPLLIIYRNYEGRWFRCVCKFERDVMVRGDAPL